MASSPIATWQIEGEKVEAVTDFLFLAPKSLRMVTEAMKSEDDCSGQESNDKPRQCVEKQRHYSANRGPYSQGYGLPSGHVRLWDLDHKEGRMPNEYMPLNCGAGEDFWKSLGQQGDQTSQS